MTSLLRNRDDVTDALMVPNKLCHIIVFYQMLLHLTFGHEIHSGGGDGFHLCQPCPILGSPVSLRLRKTAFIRTGTIKA